MKLTIPARCLSLSWPFFAEISFRQKHIDIQRTSLGTAYSYYYQYYYLVLKQGEESHILRPK